MSRYSVMIVLAVATLTLAIACSDTDTSTPDNTTSDGAIADTPAPDAPPASEEPTTPPPGAASEDVATEPTESVASDTAPAAVEPLADRAEIDYLTSFSTFGRDAYVYVAQEMGYFDEANMDVTVNPGSGTVDVMRLIAADTADFGPGDAATAAITIAEQDLPVRAVAAIQQNTLAAIATTGSTGIAEPADLEGGIFADSPGSTVAILFPFFADAAGFDDTTVEFVPSAPPDLPRLLASGQADFIGQFVVGRGLIEGATGDTAVFFPYGDFLPDLFGNVLLARQDMIEEQPEVVQAFTTALLRGLEYSIDHPEESGEILAGLIPEQDAAVAAGEVEIMGPYVRPDDFDGPIGSIDEERFTSMLELLANAGAISEDTTTDQIVAPGFVGQ